jgi:radical SAM superfamily enzyme YgiQ (UPF0313 family)
MNIAASIEGKYEWVIVDGNRERNPLEKINNYHGSGEFTYTGFTVMPEAQLTQAVTIAREIKNIYSGIIMIWGGYFPSHHPAVVLHSGYADFIINGPGDNAFPPLIDALENKKPYGQIKNLIYQSGNDPENTGKEELIDQDSLASLPNDKLYIIYSIDKYVGITYLRNKTLAYHFIMGCLFTCSFYAVMPVYEARWKGKSAFLIYRDIKYIKDTRGVDAIEFQDNNFIVSEKSSVAFSQLVEP